MLRDWLFMLMWGAIVAVPVKVVDLLWGVSPMFVAWCWGVSMGAGVVRLRQTRRVVEHRMPVMHGEWRN